jgi:hypothetical protein
LRVVLGVSALLLASPQVGHGVTVLTVGKVAASKDRADPARDRGSFRFGKDPAFAVLQDPTCPNASSIQVASYPQATQRLDAHPVAELPCSGWKAQGGGYVYDDPAAASGGVRRIVYRRSKLLIKLEGPAFRPIAGPVGYVEVWFTVGGERFLGRFHNFERNDAGTVTTRKPSLAAARGEAAFWAVLHNHDNSPGRQQVALHCLSKAIDMAPWDGRSRFLLAMMHLYRFGQATTDFAEVSPFARQELAATHEAFQRAVPRLWDGAAGDSRVPGFAAATKYMHGLLEGDDALRDAGLADLTAAVAINQFFNVFDYIPVAQIMPANDPLFGLVFAEVDDYLNQPGTLDCPETQPEICANAGLAPHNAEGALLLFGDVYAKGGDLTTARGWYTLARAVGRAGEVPWPFQALADDRVANAAARVALYQDADPANDPPVVGMGTEACAVCHYK